jgi:hypothetical protein
MRRLLAYALAALLLYAPVLAFAEDIPKNAEERYEQRYGDLIETLEKSSVSKRNFVSYVKRLQTLGFYTANTVDENSTYLSPTIKLAIALFAQCAGLPAETKFTPMIRALLQDEQFEVHPFFAPLSTAPYYKNNGKDNASYADKTLHSLQYGDKCVLEGKVLEVSEAGSIDVTLTVLSQEKGHYLVSYAYPDRSTRFVTGDQVIVYGAVTEQEAEDALCIKADLIGLKK